MDTTDTTTMTESLLRLLELAEQTRPADDPYVQGIRDAIAVAVNGEPAENVVGGTPIVGVTVDWYDGDAEYDGTNGDEFDGPGWVPFAVLADGTRVWPAGFGRPKASYDDAQALAEHVRFDDGFVVLALPQPA